MNVATHPVAQLSFRVIPDAQSLQHPHRSRPPRTHTFHTIYDAAGNVITDAEGRQFTYDAENKQVEVENGSSQLIGQYYFDGDGKRVKKVVPNGETTIFIYDASGRLIGEYSTEVQPTQDAKTQYLTADHLGTPRINTNGVGAVVSRSDYMPYGEEITSGRSSGQGYVTDDVRQGFTGYERDGETGLDFAQARYLQSIVGRFTNPDPLGSSAFTSNPQSMNRYSYVLNNPLNFVDPTGLCADDPTGTWYMPTCAGADGYKRPVYILNGDKVPDGYEPMVDLVYANSENGMYTVNDPRSANQYHFATEGEAYDYLSVLDPPPPAPINGGNTTAFGLLAPAAQQVGQRATQGGIVAGAGAGGHCLLVP